MNTKNILLNLCNLAIPPNKSVSLGLGELLKNEKRKDILEIIDNFLKENDLYIRKLRNYTNCQFADFNSLIKEFLKDNDVEKNIFINDLKEFMIKCYFSNSYVLKKTKILNDFLNAEKYLNYESDRSLLDKLNND